MITQRIVYTYKGKDYNTVRQVKEVVHDEIGKVIDNLNLSPSVPFSPGQKLALHDFLTKNREILVELLGTEFPEE